MTAARLGPAPLVADTAVLEEATLGRYVAVGPRTRIRRSSLGDYSYVMEDGDLLFAAVGKFCSIAAGVRINAPNHPTWRASQHHFTYRSPDYWPDTDVDAEFFDWRRAHAVTIGHDVWIGHGATILPGVAVGDGAVIGAGAVVTRPVDAYTIAVGVPARAVRRRFSVDISERLRRLAWWDWDHDAIGAALADFRHLPADAFLENYEPRQIVAASQRRHASVVGTSANRHETEVAPTSKAARRGADERS